MTSQQQKLLRFIERYMAEHDGVSPSLDEMASALQLKSRSGVHRILIALERQGKLRRGRHQARAIEIIGLPPALIALTDEALLAEVARRGLATIHGENGRG